MIADRPKAAQVRPPAILTVEPLMVGSALAGRLIGLSARSWQRMASAGLAPAPARIGRKRLWRLSDLRSWVACGCPAAERFAALMSSPAQAQHENGPGAVPAAIGAGLRHR